VFWVWAQTHDKRQFRNFFVLEPLPIPLPGPAFLSLLVKAQLRSSGKAGSFKTRVRGNTLSCAGLGDL